MWLRDWSRRPDVAVRLLCLPPAGGAAHLFRRWARKLPDHIGVLAVEPPGRGSRLREPPVHDLDAVVSGPDSLGREVEALLDVPLVVFGHSMGALVGRALCARLRERDPGWRPALFVAAASEAPDSVRLQLPAAGLGDEEVLEFLREHGGTPAELLADPEYRALLIPAVRADLALAAAAGRASGPVPGCPVRVYLGAGDTSVTVADTAGWQAYGDGDFARHTFDGGHFFVQQAEDEVVARLAADITGCAAPHPRATTPRG
ncbi:thioesterase II family protein [Streptantibioticus cattleyicolor]|uniref:Putative type II thioesterase n=1 Tax=Streptantibioticus cattleyicolor (strain ATCC 35852 / DSM 46488 / JCM 4925 / NBRC 14057 / NRRL 8057) TaxID=1003195 RepID=F8JMR4_STREN|nr:alpha/beta fold hydrolase [Streptantibioticus cattleyicolor]AEW99302.1 putative type II thioesterase [Streptantibioticus cattleyicolor NRRL 8057 = DSM 46488]CCB71660.1 putative type II thioesterase [Streptantibioticus cattleyicolor NRRL 8057 = DSM 46488]